MKENENKAHLPPLPAPDAIGPEPCAIVRLYLAVWADLSPEQQQQVTQHLRLCEGCAGADRLLQRTTQLVASMSASAPSARVDQAIRAAIAAQDYAQPARAPLALRRRYTQHPQSRFPGHSTRLVAVAALVLLTVLVAIYFMRAPSSQRAFILPASLTWAGYVLYEVQSGVNKQGQPYRIVTYYDLANKHMNVETTMNGTLDVVMVSDGSADLGLDMLHHVAQWDAQAWGTDESAFDLQELRHEPFMGMGVFAGQKVYRVRCGNQLIMLLDMHYMPINVVHDNGTPVYDTLKMIPASQVPSSMWDMSIPSGFHMGTLPAKS
jgi:hypothetical protein